MPSNSLVSITYWNHFLRYCREQNIAIDAVVDELGVDPEGDFVTVDQLKNLIISIQEQTGEPWLGVNVGLGIHLSSHGSLGFGLSHAKDLRQCLELVVQYYLTRFQITEMIGSVEHGDYVLSVRATSDWYPVEHVLYETILSGLANIIRFAVGTKVAECEIVLPYREPEWGARYRELLGCRVAFEEGAVAQARVPKRLLSTPCVSANPRTVDFAACQCDLELARLSQQGTLTEKVVRLVEGSVGFGLTIEAAASQLNMSKSTLIRRLKGEGTSYKAIVEGLKKTLSSRLLRESGLTVEVIALQLGYDDVSSFRRSCRRWFGCSPSEYRSGEGAAGS